MKQKLFLGFWLFLGSVLGVAGQLTDGSPVDNTMNELDSLEKSLISLEQDMILSQNKMKSLQELIDLISSQSNLQKDLLEKQKASLTQELERFSRLSSLYNQLKKDWEKLKNSSTLKNWIIGGLSVTVLASFFVGYFVGSRK